MNYDAIDIADLKELFKDGNRSAGSNFSTLIDYFGSNAVKDNGDGTIEVNGKSVDITNIADFTPSDYAILSVDANFTGGLQSNGVDVATSTDLTTGLATKQDTISYTPADDSTVLHNNTLNYMNQDNSGIVIGNDQNFGLIKRDGYMAGLAVGSGNTFKFFKTTDATLSNTSAYTKLWELDSVGRVSINSGAFFTPADDSKVVHNTGTETIAGDKTFADPVDIESSLFVRAASTFSTQPTNGTQVYPVYATSDNDTDAATLISTLQASGFSGLIGIPES